MHIQPAKPTKHYTDVFVVAFFFFGMLASLFFEYPARFCRVEANQGSKVCNAHIETNMEQRRMLRRLGLMGEEV